MGTFVLRDIGAFVENSERLLDLMGMKPEMPGRLGVVGGDLFQELDKREALYVFQLVGRPATPREDGWPSQRSIISCSSSTSLLRQNGWTSAQ